MTMNISCFPSHILVFRKITIALLSEWNDLLLAVLDEHRIPLLLLLVRTTQGLQPHYNVKRFLFGFWVECAFIAAVNRVP